MKQITHKSSFHVLASFAGRPDCKWFITPQDINIKACFIDSFYSLSKYILYSYILFQQEKISLDYFLICRSNYKHTRDCLFEAFYEKKPFLLDKVGYLKMTYN